MDRVFPPHPFSFQASHVTIVLVTALSLCNVASGDETPSPQISPQTSAYCGLYCLYTVMQVENHNVPFTDLLQGEYIGSINGSTYAELEKAAEDHGFHAFPIGGLNWKTLRNISHPTILHVKHSPYSDSYMHYVLFMGMSDNRARIIDPPHPVKLVSFPELAAKWDGTGLVLSTTPFDQSMVQGPAARRFTTMACAIILIVLALRWGRRQWSISYSIRALGRGLPVAQLALLSLACLSFGLSYHMIDEEGMFKCPDAAASVAVGNFGHLANTITTGNIQSLLEHGDMVIVDARYESDYQKGHLPGAINVPINSGNEKRQEMMRRVLHETPIIVYCQSRGCPFASRIGAHLMQDGYRNISIYRGGWNEWSRSIETH